MKIKQIEVYTYDDLIVNDDLREKVLQKLSDINTDFEWYDFIFDDAKTIGNFIGIEIDNIYFSGFNSQGDGSCFEGRYSFAKNSINNVKGYAPKDKELHRIVKELQELQKKHFYQLTATIKHRGHYYHSNCTDIQVYKDGNYAESETLETLLRDFMEWIYEQLENQYNYATSEDAILETIQANDYEFDSNGNII